MSIHRRIFFLLLFAGLASFLALGAVSFFSVYEGQEHAMETGRRMGESVAGFTEEFAVQQAKNRLLAIATEKSQRIERDISEIRNDAEYIARSMNELLAHPERRRPRRLPRPEERPIAGGEAYFFYSSELARQGAEAEFSEEIGLASNIAEDIEIMATYYKEYETSCYIGSKHGYLICADTIPRGQDSVIFTEEFLSSYDPRKRPWYLTAQTAGGAVMTRVYRGAGGFEEITCASPYYDAEGLAGVAAISTRLESLYRQAMRNETDDGTLNFALNEKGEVVFSSATKGTLAPSSEHRDVRQSKEESFALEAACMARGLSDVAPVTVDGVEYYLAYAPMPSIGWSLGTLIEKEAVVRPAKVAKGLVLSQKQDFSASMRGFFLDDLRRMALLLALLLAAIFFGSRRAAERFVRPILLLADGVRDIAKGNLDRKLDVRTGDEIEGLADCVNEMTDELKTYMDNLARVTEEKAHIATELSLAQGIQEGMLPRLYPFFPEHEEFDIYASMTPAKEVGGDFYDFYLLDENHLVVTIADVSGKGIPAALFMVISKTILKNSVLIMDDYDLTKVVEHVNEELIENNEEYMFVTAFVGILNLSDGRFIYVNAGHNAPLVYRAAKNRFAYFPADENAILGLTPNRRYRGREMLIAPGDMLYLYTDGVTEAMNEDGELYGEERLLSALGQAAEKGMNVKALSAFVRESVKAHAGEAEQSDDITMLALAYHGEKPQTREGAEAEDGQKEIVLDADVENMGRVHGFLDELLDGREVSVMTQTQLAVAVEEIFVNISDYAYAPQTGKVTIRGAILEDPPGVALTFMDEGKPYDPLKKNDPDPRLPADERGIGGWGIFLAKSNVDDISYRRQDGKNILTIRKNLQGD